MSIKEASYYEKLEENKVQCHLCPHNCKLKSGQAGICRVRSNDAGVLNTHNYGEIVSVALDPVEKKPLYHFHPGKNILSIGTIGCNFKCGFCQNYQIAHGNPPTFNVLPEAMVQMTLMSARDNSIGLAFTYNEPGIWFEYILDVARLLKEHDLKVVLVTNGFWEEKPLNELLPLVDAMNIDVKAFTEEFYRRNCKGRLGPVQRCVELAAARVHVEVTNLIIPGENDQAEEMESLARWLASINPQIPLHLSRYHPAYKFTIEATDPAVMRRNRDIARQFLKFVYMGNLWGEDNNTLCTNCQEVLIKRNDYLIDITGWENGSCKSCKARIDYIKH